MYILYNVYMHVLGGGLFLCPPRVCSLQPVGIYYYSAMSSQNWDRKKKKRNFLHIFLPQFWDSQDKSSAWCPLLVNHGYFIHTVQSITICLFVKRKAHVSLVRYRAEERAVFCIKQTCLKTSLRHFIDPSSPRSPPSNSSPSRLYSITPRPSSDSSSSWRPQNQQDTTTTKTD